MSEYLPEAIRKGLKEARVAMLRKASRLCVHNGDEVHRVLRLWDGGFAVAAGDAPRMRGFVDLFDGSRHLSQCLVVACHDEGDERIFEFKWHTPVTDRPAADFVRSEEAPVALMPVALIPRLL